MSEAVELLRRGHHAFSHDDFEAVAEIVTDDVEWGASGRFPGMDVMYRGHEGLREWMSTLKEAWETFEVQLAETVFEQGERFGVVEEVRGRGRASGVEVTMQFFVAYEMEGGKLKSRRVYPDRAALEAVR